MQPGPKKIRPASNQDYASIYEDNFVRQNDPVQLGQQAFTRQLSQGVQNNLSQTPQAVNAVYRPDPAQVTSANRIISNMPKNTDFYTKMNIMEEMTKPQVNNIGVNVPGTMQIQPLNNKINPSAQMDPQENFDCPQGYTLVNGACQRIVEEERNWAQKAGDWLVETIGGAGQKASSAVSSAVQPASTIIGAGGQLASEIISDAVTPTMQNIAQTGGQIGASVANRANPIGSAFGSAANKTFTGQDGAQADFQKGLGLTEELIKDLDRRGGDIIREQVVPAIQQGAATAADAVQKFPGTVSNYFQDEVMPRLDQVGKLATGDRFGAFVQESTTGKSIGDGQMTDNIVDKAAALVEDVKTKGVVKTLEERVQKPLATAVTDAMFAAAGGDEKVVGAVTEAITPFLQENVNPYFTGEKTVFDDMGIVVPGWLKNKKPTIVFGDYENAMDNIIQKPEEETGPTLPRDTETGETKKPGDIRTGEGETKGGELRVEDAGTGDDSQVDTKPETVTVDEETGESSTEDLTNVTNNVTNEVQTRMTELTTQLTQQISQAEQYYAREYDRILNQIAMRGRQSQVGGFTGGIQEQIQQFASAAEIQQLNALAVERNNTVQGLQAQFANIPLQAQQYANEMLSAQLQNENIRTQALSTLYTDVLNGVRTIEEAQAFADQYGLGNVSELMDRVRLAQFTNNPKINPETNEIEPYTLEDLQAMYPDKTPEELQEILDTINAGNIVQDYGDLGPEEQALAQTFEDSLNGRLTDAEGAMLGATAVGTVAALLAVAGPVGWGVGATLVIGGLIAGAFTGSKLTIGEDDLNDVVADFGKTEFFKEEKNIQGLFTASSEVSIKEPSAIAGQKPRGYGLVNDIFTITVDGRENTLEGYQILTLAMSLHKQGVLDDPANAVIKETADRIYESMPFDFYRLGGAATGDVKNIVYNLYKQNLK